MICSRTNTRTRAGSTARPHSLSLHVLARIQGKPRRPGPPHAHERVRNPHWCTRSRRQAWVDSGLDRGLARYPVPAGGRAVRFRPTATSGQPKPAPLRLPPSGSSSAPSLFLPLSFPFRPTSPPSRDLEPPGDPATSAPDGPGPPRTSGGARVPPGEVDTPVPIRQPNFRTLKRRKLLGAGARWWFRGFPGVRRW